MPPSERAVDEQARADIRRSVDVRLEPRMRWNVAGVMMVEIADARARNQGTCDGGAVRVERDVEHGQLVAAHRRATLDQPDLAFRAGDELGLARLREAQLMQGADPVGVAIEDVI